MKVDFLEELILYRYRYWIAYTLVAISITAALALNISQLVPGIANVEAVSALNNFSLSSILESPLNAPYKLLQWLSTHSLGGSELAIRLPSLITGGVFLSALYATLTIWHRQRIAIIATLFAATSSWFLHWARLGTDYITLAAVMMLVILLASWLHHGEDRYWKYLLAVFVIAVAAYTPLIVPMLILFVVLYRKRIGEHLGSISIPAKLSLGLLLILVVSPLIYGFLNDPSLIRDWLGIPASLPSPLSYLENLNQTFAFMFWRAEPNPLLHLGDLPMLDIFTATMTALGLYHYERHSDHLRTSFAIWGFFLALLLVSFTGSQAASVLLLPFVFIFAATGVITLLNQWYNIFPRNPIARLIGFVPVVLLLISVMGYHSERYFIAWPNNQATVEQFPADSHVLRSNVAGSTQVFETILIVAEREDVERLRAALLDVERTALVIPRERLGEQDMERYSTLYVANELEDIPEIESLGEPERFVASSSARTPIEFKVYGLAPTSVD